MIFGMLDLVRSRCRVTRIADFSSASSIAVLPRKLPAVSSDMRDRRDMPRGLVDKGFADADVLQSISGLALGDLCAEKHQPVPGLRGTGLSDALKITSNGRSYGANGGIGR